jgi:predicted ATP-grasp superfamily ATP-dependent carboligase
LTRQLVGTSWLGATGFCYAGSIGPIDCTAATRSTWRRIGEALAGEFDLRGLFGVDAVQDRGGRIWPVEVNPRLVASVEVLERAGGWAALADHVRACRDGVLAAPPRGQCCCGKAIVYADANIAVGPELAAWIAAQNCGVSWPNVADIPATGQAVRRGWPVLTVMAQGRDERAVAGTLRTLAGQVRRRLQPAAIA